MLDIPSDNKKLTRQALDWIEECRQSQASRTAYCRSVNQTVETGRNSGPKALLNLLPFLLDRFASHLFSPTELQFTIDYENVYPKNILEFAKVGARLLSRHWERSNTDMTFARGVYEAGKYGACILKQWVQEEGEKKTPVYHKRLVMPWQFGVAREDENELGKQSMMCETTLMTMPEVWRRVYMLPDADKLYKRIETHSMRGLIGDTPNSFFHQVLSSSQINTSGQGGAVIPGGVVSLTSDANYPILEPQIGANPVRMHELWVQGEKDYCTIQIIEPDILVSPVFNRSNLLIKDSGLHPYTLIQMNEVSGYFWGRSEISDVVEAQGLLATTADDMRRMLGVQIDKLLGFSGYDGLADELYDQGRAAGYFNMPAGATVNDITPAWVDVLPILKYLVESINMQSGFPEIMQGRGEPGVRAGVHADTLLKTGSPTLRDRSLLVERQCATAADLTFALKEAKDGKTYWWDGSDIKKADETSFLLGDIPEDRRISVDSHSSSPIFADDHRQLVAEGAKLGVVGGHSIIDLLPFPQKALLHAELKEKQEKEAAMLEDLKKNFPEAYEKVLAKGKH